MVSKRDFRVLPSCSISLQDLTTSKEQQVIKGNEKEELEQKFSRVSKGARSLKLRMDKLVPEKEALEKRNEMLTSNG